MAKKVVSVALHKKKPVKHSNRRTKLKTVFKKILNYMKSDTYMFAPLVYPQSYLTSFPASFGEMSSEPIEKKEKKKLAQDVKDYLKCDCYMYAPFVMDSASDSASPPKGDRCRGKADTGSVCDQMEPRMEETTRQDENTPNSFREIDHDDSYNPVRRIVVKHNLLQKETVKHVVHQNCRSSPVPGM
ncbi:hypothetical protein Pfo_000754 [Paulownia fortunei]|nr:hypothetical protein Pfo_000754 [Paulownia fortunei]